MSDRGRSIQPPRFLQPLSTPHRVDTLFKALTCAQWMGIHVTYLGYIDVLLRTRFYSFFIVLQKCRRRQTGGLLKSSHDSAYVNFFQFESEMEKRCTFFIQWYILTSDLYNILWHLCMSYTYLRLSKNNTKIISFTLGQNFTKYNKNILSCYLRIFVSKHFFC